jgi:hypothetical protein
MASFVTVISSVTAEQLEKIIGIQVRSENKLRFVPQGFPGQPHNPNAGVLSSPPLVQTTANEGQPPKQVVAYVNVRLEWDEKAGHFFREVLDLFPHHHECSAVRAA